MEGKKSYKICKKTCKIDWVCVRMVSVKAGSKHYHNIFGRYHNSYPIHTPPAFEKLAAFSVSGVLRLLAVHTMEKNKIKGTGSRFCASFLLVGNELIVLLFIINFERAGK